MDVIITINCEKPRRKRKEITKEVFEGTDLVGEHLDENNLTKLKYTISDKRFDTFCEYLGKYKNIEINGIFDTK